MRKSGTNMAMTHSTKTKPISMRGTSDKVIATTKKLMEAP